MREIGTIGENGKSFLHFSYTSPFGQNDCLPDSSLSARQLVTAFTDFLPKNKFERIRISSPSQSQWMMKTPKSPVTGSIFASAGNQTFYTERVAHWPETPGGAIPATASDSLILPCSVYQDER
jgi:hypothetical protein